MEYPPPARTLADAFNACDPAQPLLAGDPRYVDLTPGRGGHRSAVTQCRQRILRSAEPLVQLFVGHQGCGKSTELRRLQAELEAEEYFVVFVEADLDVDLQDAQPTDVLLALVRQLDLALRNADVALPPEHLQDFLGWFSEVVLTSTERRDIEGELSAEASVQGSVPLFAKLLARLTGRIKTGVQSKREVRQSLDPQLSELLERTRWLTAAARLALRRKSHKDLVLIVDSLDRIALKTIEGRATTSHEMLFIERGELLKGLGCHAVYTVPISLLFSPRLPNLTAIFPEPHVLPMVKIAERGSRAAWAPGRSLLSNLLESRLDLEKVFEPGACEILIDASGGHPRQLMRLVRSTFDFTTDLPVSRNAAARAVQRLVNYYSRAIREGQWKLLTGVYSSQEALNDADHQQLLENLSVLEYQNDERWCDVNPVVTRLPQFQRALRPARAKSRQSTRVRKPASRRTGES